MRGNPGPNGRGAPLPAWETRPPGMGVPVSPFTSGCRRKLGRGMLARLWLPVRKSLTPLCLPVDARGRNRKLKLAYLRDCDFRQKILSRPLFRLSPEGGTGSWRGYTLRVRLWLPDRKCLSHLSLPVVAQGRNRRTKRVHPCLRDYDFRWEVFVSSFSSGCRPRRNRTMERVYPCL